MKEIRKGTTSVFAVDTPEKGKPICTYSVKSSNLKETYATIQFQDGPVKEVGVNGAREEDLLAILIDRIRSFQSTKHACRETALALTKLDEALHWLNHRNDERKERGVKGTSKS